jgi:hypothetical protein
LIGVPLAVLPVAPVTLQQNVVVVVPPAVDTLEPKYVTGHGLLVLGGTSATRTANVAVYELASWKPNDPD